MDDDIAKRVYSDPVARWFVTEAYRIVDTAELVKAAGEQLVLAGIPLCRLAYFQITLHPEFAGKGYVWRRGQGVEVGIRPHSDDRTDKQDAEYRDNPLPVVFEEQAPTPASSGAAAANQILLFDMTDVISKPLANAGLWNSAGLADVGPSHHRNDVAQHVAQHAPAGNRFDFP